MKLTKDFQFSTIGDKIKHLEKHIIKKLNPEIKRIETWRWSIGLSIILEFLNKEYNLACVYNDENKFYICISNKQSRDNIIDIEWALIDKKSKHNLQLLLSHQSKDTIRKIYNFIF